MVEDLPLAISTDFLRRLQRPASGKDGESLEQGFLAVFQQIVTPVDERPQRLLSWQRRAAASGEESEAILQATLQLLDGQRAYPRRRQFDRQGDAVQTTAYGDKRPEVLRRGRKVRLDGRRPLDKEPRRFVLEQGLRRQYLQLLSLGRQREGGDAIGA